jgi:hypothetical protein
MAARRVGKKSVRSAWVTTVLHGGGTCCCVVGSGCSAHQRLAQSRTRVLFLNRYVRLRACTIANRCLHQAS